MARRYKSTIKGVCWKQHTCAVCNSVYRYRFERTGQASASTPQKSQQAAQKNLDSALKNTFDMRPCPHCGLVQPEMVGQKRGDAHGCMIGLSFLALVVMWILYGTGWAQYNTISYIAAAVGAFIAIRHILASVHNPNENLAANKVKAAADVQSGVTVLVTPGVDPGLGTVGTEVSGAIKFASLLLLVALALFPAAEFLRIASGWTFNNRCDPPVVGPGERVRYFTGDTIHSVKGYWGGTVAVSVANAPALGLMPSAGAFSVSTQSANWGTSIRYKSSESSNSSDIFVDIDVPNSPALTGRTALLNFDVAVNYPQSGGGSILMNGHSKFKSSVNLAISNPGSGGRYIALWWTGMIVGFVFQIVGGFVLNSKAGSLKKGLPTQLIPIG